MKTIILFCFVSLFVFSANSQISKGTVLLGGNIGYNQSNYTDAPTEYKNHGYYISPSIGFVVKDNRVFGFSISYSHSINQTTADSKSFSNNYGAGVFHRRYLPLGKNFYLFGQGHLYADFGKQEYQSSTTNSKKTITTVGAGLFPGVAYAINKRFHLELSMNNLISLGYSSIKDHNSSGLDIRNNQFNFALNANPTSNLALGFRVLLGNK